MMKYSDRDSATIGSPGCRLARSNFPRTIQSLGWGDKDSMLRSFVITSQLYDSEVVR